MRLSNRMGLLFTHAPDMPPGSRVFYKDLVSIFARDYVDKKARRRKIIYWILFLLVLAWGGVMIYLNFFHGFN
jgi:hypothetical protein